MPIRKTAIVTDSACDLENSLLEKYHIKFVPLRLVYQGGEVRDRLEVSAEQVYDMLSREIPKTSLPLPEDVLRVYDELADEGYTDAVHISISSGLSGTYNMVRILASEYKRLNVRVVDSKTLSMQEGLIVLSCARLLEKTQDVEEIAAHAVALREKSLGMFVIRTLEYLRKGRPYRPGGGRAGHDAADKTRHFRQHRRHISDHRQGARPCQRAGRDAARDGQALQRRARPPGRSCMARRRRRAASCWPACVGC